MLTDQFLVDLSLLASRSLTFHFFVVVVPLAMDSHQDWASIAEKPRQCAARGRGSWVKMKMVMRWAVRCCRFSVAAALDTDFGAVAVSAGFQLEVRDGLDVLVAVRKTKRKEQTDWWRPDYRPQCSRSLLRRCITCRLKKFLWDFAVPCVAE